MWITLLNSQTLTNGNRYVLHKTKVAQQLSRHVLVFHVPSPCVGVPSNEIETDDKDRDWMTEIKPEIQRP